VLLSQTIMAELAGVKQLVERYRLACKLIETESE
jgi:hypothetical protein